MVVVMGTDRGREGENRQREQADRTDRTEGGKRKKQARWGMGMGMQREKVGI